MANRRVGGIFLARQRCPFSCEGEPVVGDGERRVERNRREIGVGGALELAGAHEAFALQVRLERRQRRRRERGRPEQTVSRRVAESAEEASGELVHQLED
jgi:hypothetical protein